MLYKSVAALAVVGGCEAFNAGTAAKFGSASRQVSVIMEEADAPAPPAPAPVAAPARAATPSTGGGMNKAGLVALAESQNPIIGYFDPLGLADESYWEMGEQATIGWLRHAEMKHGRVAMMGFIGYIFHENGIHWPWPLTTAQPDYSAYEGLSAPAVWDAIPEVAKWQIILVCGFFEYWSEDTQYGRGGEPHYTKGGKPGMFPAFKNKIPHPVPFDLFDPFGTTKKLSEETKAKKLNIEINNGRLAMFGIMGFVAEAKVPGSVPGLSGLIKGYDGNVMAPFEANFHLGQF